MAAFYENKCDNQPIILWVITVIVNEGGQKMNNDDLQIKLDLLHSGDKKAFEDIYNELKIITKNKNPIQLDFIFLTHI